MFEKGQIVIDTDINQKAEIQWDDGKKFSIKYIESYPYKGFYEIRYTEEDRKKMKLTSEKRYNGDKINNEEIGGNEMEKITKIEIGKKYRTKGGVVVEVLEIKDGKIKMNAGGSDIVLNEEKVELFDIDSKPTPEPTKPTPETKKEPVAETKPEPKPETKPEPKPEPKHKQDTEAKPKSKKPEPVEPTKPETKPEAKKAKEEVKEVKKMADEKKPETPAEKPKAEKPADEKKGRKRRREKREKKEKEGKKEKSKDAAKESTPRSESMVSKIVELYVEGGKLDTIISRAVKLFPKKSEKKVAYRVKRIPKLKRIKSHYNFVEDGDKVRLVAKK